MTAINVNRRDFLAATVSTLLAPDHAMGQAWPSRAVRVLVGLHAGSPVDVPTRAVAARLSQRYGAQFMVENRGGAGGVIAADPMVKSPPDGYTPLSAGPTEVINNFFIWRNSGQKFPCDPERDLFPVAMLQRGPGVLVAGPTLGISTRTELVRQIRARPGMATIGVTQLGATTHLASELLKREAGLDITIVPYRGPMEMSTDVSEERRTMMLSTPFETVEHVRRGDLKALAVSHTVRMSGMQQVPIFGELGLPNVIKLPFLLLCAPAGTPRDVVESLNRAVAEEIAGAPPDKPSLTPFGREAPVPGVDELHAYSSAERRRWGQLIMDLNIRV